MLQATWKTAKRSWEREGLPHVRAAVLAQMDQDGWRDGDLGKLLGQLDKAKDLEGKQVAWSRARIVCERYLKSVSKAAQTSNLDPRGKKALKQLAVVLANLKQAGVEATQPPTPSGRSAQLRVVSKMNLAAGLKTEHLQVGKLEVSAWVVVDQTVVDLEKAGALGFRWQELQTGIGKLLDDAGKRFRATILDLDAKLGKLPPERRRAKEAEAKQVLEFYRKAVERRINEVADQFWTKARKRRKYLEDFEHECKVDIAVSTITIAVSSTSVAMSFGSAAVGVVVIAKAALEIALVIEKLGRDAEKLKPVLRKKMVGIEKLWASREQAKEEGKRQLGSKAAQAGKEAVASAIGTVSAKLMTTSSRTLKEAKEYTGKLSRLEDQAGRMLDEIDRYTAKFPSAPEGPDAATTRRLKKAHEQFEVMARRYQELATSLSRDIEWGEACVETCEKLVEEDAFAENTKTAGTTTKAVIGLSAAAKLTWDLVKVLA